MVDSRPPPPLPRPNKRRRPRHKKRRRHQATVIANNLQNLRNTMGVAAPASTDPSPQPPSAAPLVQLPNRPPTEFRDPKSNILISYQVSRQDKVNVIASCDKKNVIIEDSTAISIVECIANLLLGGFLSISIKQSVTIF